MSNTTLSRLEQVFSLLENGSSVVARKAAAKQIGDVQKKHPEELNALLIKLLPYTKHSEWDTRVAGVEAIEALVMQVKKWKVDSNDVLKEEADLKICEKPLMNFDEFDIEELLLNSKTMVASSGDHMNIVTDKLSKQSRLKNQRKYIDKKFGFGNNISCSLSVSSLVKDDDLEICKSEEGSSKKVELKSIKEECTSLSSREKNVAMRRARMARKQKNRENNSIDEEPVRKQRKKSSDSASINSDDDLENCPKYKPNQNEWKEWPFNWIYNKLIVLLFDDSWESRHGSCMAIKSIVKYHGNSIGKIKNASNNEYRNECYLNDLALRLISVISLDRFADFVSDQVVAPVRESCAQALSVLTTFMKPKNVECIIKLLSNLRKRDDWGLRQSAIVTLQYIIAVKTDILSEILPLCLDDLIAGMNDLDDDVKSSAAKSFIPTIDLLVSHEKYKDTVVSLVKILWDSLLDYDDLTASTQSVMSLLSEIIKAVPNKSTVLGANTENFASRFSPFFVHVDEKVRKAAIDTFSTVLEVEIQKTGKSNGKIIWSDCTVVKFLSDLFCACMLEKSDALQEQLLKVFRLLVRNISKNSLDVALESASLWLNIMSQQMSNLFSCEILNNFPILTALGKNNDNGLYIGGIYHCTSQMTENEVHISITRHNLASMLGVLCLHSTNGISLVEPLLIPYHESPSSLHRSVASDVLSSIWTEAFYINEILVWPSDKMRKSLETVLNQQIYYSEIANEVVELQKDANYYFTCLKKKSLFKKEVPEIGSYTPDNVIQLCSSMVENLHSASMNCNKELIEQCDFLLTSAQKVNKSFACVDNRAKSCAAQVFVESSKFLCKFDTAHNLSTLWKLPAKLNNVIRPLMETIKKETNEAIVLKTSHTLSKLIEVCVERVPCPNSKLIKNLTVTLTTNRSLYPTNEYIQSFFSKSIIESFRLENSDLCRDAILTILYQRCKMEACLKKNRNTLADQSLKENISSDNASICLKTICSNFKEKLFDSVGHVEKILSFINEDDSFLKKTSDFELKVLIQAIALLSSIFNSLESTIAIKVIEKYLRSLLNLLYHDCSNVRFITSNCLALMAKYQPRHVLPSIIEEVLPNFESSDLSKRRGSVETLANVVNKLGSNVVSYAVLFVVPLLGKMGDFDSQIRLLSTYCFANLIQYIPVESSIPDPVDMPHSLIKKKIEDRKFLEQLFDSRSLEEYEVPIKINANLREYQQDGVKWLAFLNRYKLHGILCDDMGLGKTLQTICIVASDHFYKEKLKKHRSKVMSLVICPPTLTGHWVEETLKFCDYLKPLHYYGNPTDRNRLQKQVQNYNMVVASYEVVRNDINFFSKFFWNYCILDEGHIIRNGKSKISLSVKTLKANHRLILTGTPIQNNVLELWSLFDFLIPGFLGTEHEFSQKFTKPIVASRDAKCSSKEQESGLLAMNALHRQVLPFMLRRMKEDVLKDLPPKIIQDYYCNLSPLQLELYEDFAKSRAKKMAESSIKELNEVDEKSTVNKTCHVFQALQYLQKVCNHPAFVLTPNHPQYKTFCDKMKKNKNKLMDIRNSCKLTALKQLLHSCGIGTSASNSVVSEHRALLFCKHKNMMDVIEHSLFKQHLPELTYTRLDASLQANQRFSVVNKFNKDPSIDILLLSTKVGGLGLNLTGADTVIFMEHDWNPTTDLQAMDRAHRIGQKKTVTVYRIITKDTLEEKIMGLQKFKLNVANTVVSQDNRALSSMGTSQVLGLFDVGVKNKKEKKVKNSSSKGFKSMVNGLNELWEESQYEDQYNLDNFIKSMQ